MVKKNMFVYRAYIDLRDDPIHKYTEQELEDTAFDEEEIISSIQKRSSYSNFFWKRTREEVEVEEDPIKILGENLLKNPINKDRSKKACLDKTIRFFLKQLSIHLDTETKGNTKLFFKRTKKNNPALFLKAYVQTVAVVYSCNFIDDENVNVNIFYNPSYIQKEETYKYVSGFLEKNDYTMVAGRKIKISFSEM